MQDAHTITLDSSSMMKLEKLSELFSQSTSSMIAILICQALDQHTSPAPSAMTKNTDIVLEIFQHWQKTMNHAKAKLDTDRKRRILNALLSGYTVDELKSAINGCAMTPHNMGMNENNTAYNGLNVIFKSSENIERFINTASSNNRPMSKASMQIENSIRNLQGSFGTHYE